MAFGKKKLRFTKVGKIIILIVSVLAGLGVISFMVFSGMFGGYKSELNTMKTDLKKVALMCSNKVLAGTKIGEDNFYETEIQASLPQEQFITKDDFGKVLLIDVEPNTPIMKAMTFDEGIQKDLREEELNMLLLPSNLLKNQYIDVRLGFPNGEDYIVLSKKKVRETELSMNTIWIWIEEKEILTLSSAIVDAYLHKGSKLYTVTYVAPSMQDKAAVTYPVNQDVLKDIKNNPNILEEAKKSLSEEARRLLDERLSRITDSATQSVESGVKEETVQRENKINKEQESLQNQLPSEDTLSKENGLKPNKNEGTNPGNNQMNIQEPKENQKGGKESETFY